MSISGNETGSTGSQNVYDIFSGRKLHGRNFIRLAPELDGLEMLYSNKLNPGKLFAMKILCWGLRRDGEVTALLPWMNKLIPCEEIDDPLEGRFEGYYDPGIDQVFHEAPLHKVVELESAAEYYEFDSDNPNDIVQEIPDTIGTHAVFNAADNYHLMLTEVISWRLMQDGRLQGMVVDEKKCEQTPVLPGDDCLFSATDHPNFRYFFQHHIANKIKARDPEALAAIAMLVEKELADKKQIGKPLAEVVPVDKNKPL